MTTVTITGGTYYTELPISIDGWELVASGTYYLGECESFNSFGESDEFEVEFLTHKGCDVLECMQVPHLEDRIRDACLEAVAKENEKRFMEAA